jgi:hypothetical protein
MDSSYEKGFNKQLDEFFGLTPDNEQDSLILMSYIFLFNNKFKNLMNYFIIKDYNEVYNFIKNNENIFELLDEIKPILSSYFNNNKFLLRISKNPENSDAKLKLIIKADYSFEDTDDLVKRLVKLNSEIRPFKRQFDVVNEFLVDVECL